MKQPTLFLTVGLPGTGKTTAARRIEGLAALCEVFGPAEARALAARLPVFQGISESSLATVARMIETGVACVPARGMGCWFDAAGALALGISTAGFEGHVAIALEEAAFASELEPYPFALPSALALDGGFGPEHEALCGRS